MSSVTQIILPPVGGSASWFTDGFESGGLSSTGNGVSWSSSANTTVNTTRPYAGSYALQFKYTGVPTGSDSVAEQRVNCPQTGEVWCRYWLWVPSNYYHRDESPGASNNKFFAAYSKLYENPGFQVNVSTEPITSGPNTGGSDLYVHYYTNGVDRAARLAASAFIVPADYGAWMKLVIRVKPSSGAGALNGIVQVWKNDVLTANITNLDAYDATKNYIDQCYLLGWANSGYTNDTYFYVDDFSIGPTSLT